jgi:putative membrane protein insertion efficiency factor
MKNPILQQLVLVPRRLAIGLLRVYQLIISPMLGPTCRFSPSCSHSACACLQEHGMARGSWLTLRRLSRCHPWHPGGYDPPPPLEVGAGQRPV